jgi:hypothetical protein
MKFRADVDENESGEAKGESGMDEIVHRDDNENAEGNEREGWKVVGFGIAWF